MLKHVQACSSLSVPAYSFPWSLLRCQLPYISVSQSLSCISEPVFLFTQCITFMPELSNHGKESRVLKSTERKDRLDFLQCSINCSCLPLHSPTPSLAIKQGATKYMSSFFQGCAFFNFKIRHGLQEIENWKFNLLKCEALMKFTTVVGRVES